VFEKIQCQIMRKVAKMDVKAIERQKQEMYQDFLNNTNTKPLFRDIIIESDYNPLAWRRSTVHYNSKEITDPVKRELTQQYNDREGIGGMGLGVPQARTHHSDLPETMWDSEPPRPAADPPSPPQCCAGML
jgi:hypothetical protein